MTDFFAGPGPDPIEPGEAAQASPAGEPEESAPATQAGGPEDPMSPASEQQSAAYEWPAGAEEPRAQAGDLVPPAPAQAETSAAPGARPIAPREYYSISEVCDLVGLKPHVLRYWESQFPVLNPSKNRSGNRVYQRKEIKLILLVQHLLYKEKYTIEGARQRLDLLRRGGKTGELAQATSQALDSEMRQLLKEELQQLLEVLAPAAHVAPSAAMPPAHPSAPSAPSAPREGRRPPEAADAPVSSAPAEAAE